MSRGIQVLSVGYDCSLMASRSMLLRNAGYGVEEAFSRDQALALVRSDGIDIMLMCHTVPEMERRALISAVRTKRLLIPILCISDNEFSYPSLDGCTTVSNAPAELLAAIDAATNPLPNLP